MRSSLQTALGFTILPPTGFTSHVLSNASVLGGSTKIADVLLTDSYTSYTTGQRSAIMDFIQRQGSGLVLGGQAWCVRCSWGGEGVFVWHC